MSNAVRTVAAAGLALITLQGCLARTAVDVVTLPVRAASKGIDLATTSQSEADQKRGREVRQREERLGRLEREYARQMNSCQDGRRPACDSARATYAEMQMLMPGIPVER
jgi:hypothetical protein